MAVPSFLSSSYYVHQALGVADMDLALDEIYTALNSQTPAWTIVDGRASAPPTLLCTSPVDADGRFFDVLFTATAASSNLKMDHRVRDKDGTSVCTRRCTGSASATWDIIIFSGQYHLAIDYYINAAAPESFNAGITDNSPEAQTQNLTHCTYGMGTRNGDSVANDAADYAFMIDNATATGSARIHAGQGLATSANGVITQSGYRRYLPREFWCRPTGEATNLYYAGRGYQQVFVPYSSGVGGSLPPRSRITVPIDIGTTGVFQVFSQPVSALGVRRLAWRVA